MSFVHIGKSVLALLSLFLSFNCAALETSDMDT